MYALYDLLYVDGVEVGDGAGYVVGHAARHIVDGQRTGKIKNAF